MPQIKIVYAVLDGKDLTMYDDKGNKHIIKQGDQRLASVVSEVFPAIEINGSYELDFDKHLNKSQHYADLQKSSNGFVRFFRMAKAKAKELLGLGNETDVESPRAAGSMPVKEKPAEELRSAKAVADIMAHAAPAGTAEFDRLDAEGEAVTVAVVGEQTVISGVDKLENQLKGIALKLGNAIGVENFFRRLATVKRDHSVQSLLEFMQKGELPIADDGSVLVYKLLQSTKEKGVFVDIHSKKVKQRVGTRVFMAESLVDHDRHRDCSNGLHVARRDYLGSFGGDVCVLAKLAPEDVIAVPHGDARKLRACGYHIIAQLSDDDRRNVLNDKPLTDVNLLGNAVAGNHIEITNTAEITKQYGEGVIYVDLLEDKKVVLDENLTSGSLDQVAAAQEASTKVDAKEVALSKGQAKAIVKPDPAPKAEPVKPALTKVQQLVENFISAKNSDTEYAAAEALAAHKKSSKKNWTALGIAAAVHGRVSEVLAKPDPRLQPKADAVKVGPKGKPSKAPAKKAEAPKGGKAGQAALLWSQVEKGDRKAAASLLALKKSSKKSYTALGLPDTAAAKVDALTK